MLVRNKEKLNRVKKLFDIINGSNFIEIEEPEGGWSSAHKFCVWRDDHTFGKFFIKQDGTIDYMNKSFTIVDLKNYHESLLDLAILQLEKKCRNVIFLRTQSSKFPNLYQYLIKYYGL